MEAESQIRGESISDQGCVKSRSITHRPDEIAIFLLALLLRSIQLQFPIRMELELTNELGGRIKPKAVPLQILMVFSAPSSELLTALKTRQDLHQQNLSRYDLRGIDLQNAHLSRASLIGANLAGVNLSHANLENADLRGANLRGANLNCTNLQGAYLNRANLQTADLSQANLEGAKLQLAWYCKGTIWAEGFSYRSSGAIGPCANLSGAYLNTANLREADLQEANLLGAYLSGTDLTCANLQGAKLSGADLRKAFLTGAYLRQARLNGVNLQNADLRAADFTGVEIEHLESIAGADFFQVQGMSDATRAKLLSRPSAELDVWNAFTRRTTRESLQV